MNTLKEKIESFLGIGFEMIKSDRHADAVQAFNKAKKFIDQLPNDFKCKIDNQDDSDVFHPTNCPMQIKVAIQQQLDFIVILNNDNLDNLVWQMAENIWKNMEKIPDDVKVNVNRGHGSPFDRGGADYYYGRPFNPHYWPEGTYKGEIVEKPDMTKEQVDEYSEGYKEAMELGDRKY